MERLQCENWNNLLSYSFVLTRASSSISRCRSRYEVVRDSSAVRRLFVRLAGAVGHQSALHRENSGFAAPTLGRHISTCRGYRILFSIRNPYINRFTNHFFIHSQPSYPQKVVLHSITTQFCLRPYHFVIWLSFSNICHVTSRKLRLLQCIMGDDLHI